ncbi:MAG: hypothetical protein Q9161_000737 [Pseudevernia consocians]
MHQEHGSIVRISPFELHIDDVEFYDELYVAGSTRRTMKYGWAVKLFGRILERMQAEMKGIWPEDGLPPKWQQLEQPSYLNAVVNEGLRMSYGVTHRLQRISPDVALQYKDWTIPINTPVGISSPLMHVNPEIFPNPEKFSPESLAYCEIYITLAAIFAPNRFRIELFEMDISDVEIHHDFITPFYNMESKGIRVLVN